MALSLSRATWTAAMLVGGASFAAATVSLVRRARALDLRGKVVVITGGSRGLGLLLAEEACRQGARVAICGRDPAALASAERRLSGHGAEVLAERCDLGDRAAAMAFIEHVANRFGRIDVVINNAGVIQVAPLELVDPEMIEQTMRSNFWSAVNTTFAALPYLRRQGRNARIVNITSIGGRIPVPHMLGYTASKFAMVGLSEALHAELAASGIKVTTVVPSPMRTGSIYNAEFYGEQRREFEWFSAVASLPITSISARRAARRIVRAMREGWVELHLGWPARVVPAVHGIAPSTFGRLNEAMVRLLPRPAQNREGIRGRALRSPLQGSLLLRLGDRAARANNEEPPV